MRGPVCCFCGSNNTEYDPEWVNVWECKDCQRSACTPDSLLPSELRPAPAEQRQLKLGIEPGKQFNTIKPSEQEEGTQRDIMTELCRGGWTVLQTTVRFPMQICTNCKGKHRHNPVADRKTGRAKGYGASKGVSDLLFFRPWYPLAAQGAIEVKAWDWEYSCEEQKIYHGQGNIVIARTVNDAILFARRMDRAMQLLARNRSAWELAPK